MLVGGTAVALHGYYRHSMGPTGQPANKPDIDLWFEPTYENYFNLLRMIEALGHDVTDFRSERQPDPNRSFFRLDMGGFALDALPHIHADILFADAFARREVVMLQGLPVHYISYEDLLADKQRSARAKDQDDVENLKRQRGTE